MSNKTKLDRLLFLENIDLDDVIDMKKHEDEINNLKKEIYEILEKAEKYDSVLLSEGKTKNTIIQ